MGRLGLSCSVALLLLATLCRGQGDFDLSDALGNVVSTKNPSSVTKKPDDDLNLEDALSGGDDSKKPAPPPPQPKPGSHGNSGGISDSDLYEGELPPENPQSGRASNPSSGGHDSDSSGNTEGSQGMLAGIISSVVVAIAGAVSSFIAYQKKKLCFKASDQENVNAESQQGAHAEPPVQRTLLQKQ
ncbi:CD99 antigen isoform X1 [Python bivittatus]|uniref:CD99 antigen isoform X1 n=1 Tax=Python bivittatus TaxID=176946 RepID=A0A9F2NC87_PYTBI|nr:CD99 antigen isoform X1 [Python bivittatus]